MNLCPNLHIWGVIDKPLSMLLRMISDRIRCWRLADLTRLYVTGPTGLDSLLLGCSCCLGSGRCMHATVALYRKAQRGHVQVIPCRISGSPFGRPFVHMGCGSQYPVSPSHIAVGIVVVSYLKFVVASCRKGSQGIAMTSFLSQISRHTVFV